MEDKSLIFFVIRDNKTGMFLKKYQWSYTKPRATAESIPVELLTKNVGNARVFSSEHAAKAAIPAWTKGERSWLTEGIVSIVKMTATIDAKKLPNVDEFSQAVATYVLGNTPNEWLKELTGRMNFLDREYGEITVNELAELIKEAMLKLYAQ